jgi:hypothetical protein
MHIKKIYKIMELIDERIEALTNESFEELLAGAGTLTILEESIDQVLWDKDSIEYFWKTHQNTTYDGTPCENNIVYEILSKYFFEKITVWYDRNLKYMTIGQLKAVTAGMYHCTIETHNFRLNHDICVFNDWMDNIPSKHDRLDIDYIRIERINDVTNIIINIGESVLTEEDF